MSIIMAVDPGPRESAWIRINSDGYKPIDMAKSDNSVVRSRMYRMSYDHLVYDHLVIEECIARKYSGRDITDTAFEAGRIAQASLFDAFTLISRSKVRGHTTKSNKGKDSTIIEALIQLFEPELYIRWHKKEISRPKMLIEAKKGFFKGFHSDIWQAFALGYTFINITKGV